MYNINYIWWDEAAYRDPPSSLATLHLPVRTEFHSRARRREERKSQGENSGSWFPEKTSLCKYPLNTIVMTRIAIPVMAQTQATSRSRPNYDFTDSHSLRPPSVGGESQFSMATLDVDGMARRNEERMRWLENSQAREHSLRLSFQKRPNQRL